jgi:hypothetical protein
VDAIPVRNSVPEMSMAARQFIFHYRRGSGSFQKKKIKKLVNLHKIFILKNATL